MAPTRQKNYTVAIKLTVFERIEEIGNCATWCEYENNESCIHQWKLKN